jgi:hypothetical protein
MTVGQVKTMIDERIREYRESDREVANFSAQKDAVRNRELAVRALAVAGLRIQGAAIDLTVAVTALDAHLTPTARQVLFATIEMLKQNAATVDTLAKV